MTFEYGIRKNQKPEPIPTPRPDLMLEPMDLAPAPETTPPKDPKDPEPKPKELGATG